MFEVFTVTDWHRREYAARLVKELDRTMPSIDRPKIMVAENGTNWEHSLLGYIKRNANVETLGIGSFEERDGLARRWNWCMTFAQTDWVVILNDDCVPLDGWVKKLEGLITKLPHGMFLLCHPNGFSGFCLSKKMWEENGKFRDEFPEGYYEDDDWFLRVAFNNNTDKKGVFQKHIFSYYDNFGESLFVHKPDNAISITRKWDREANKRVFDKYWKEVPPNTQDSVQNKGGKWYTLR